MIRKCLKGFILSVALLYVLELLPGKLDFLLGNMMLVAEAEEMVTITFKSEEGYIFGNSETKEYNNKVGKGEAVDEAWCYCMNNPSRAFKGWKVEGDDKIYYTDHRGFSNGNDIRDYIPTNDTVFVAQWVDAWNVSFDPGDGYLWGGSDASKSYTLQIEKGKNISEDIWCDNYDSYKFIGWRIQGDESDELYSLLNYIPESDVTFLAEWREVDFVTVTFHSDEGYMRWNEDEKDYEIQVAVGDTIDYFPSTNRNGYRIKGYTLDGDDSLYVTRYYAYENTKLLEEYIVTKDTTFNVVWEKMYDVTFHSEEGFMFGNEDEKDYKTQIAEGKVIYIEPPAYREGYIAVGYIKEGSDTLYTTTNWGTGNGKSINEYVVTEDTTFNVVWKKAYTVTFHSEEGYINGNEKDYSFQVVVGEKVGEKINSFPYISREGYVVSGYKINGDNNTTYIHDYIIKESYINKENTKNLFEYVVNEDVVFNVQWEKLSSDESESDNKQEEKKQADNNKEDAKTDNLSVNTGDSDNSTTNDVIKDYSVGETATDNGNNYMVGADATVTYISSEDTALSTVAIPDTVNLNGKEYKVTDVAEGSFSYNDNLKSVTIGANVKTIGKDAYAGCKNLTTVTVKGSSLLTIDTGAFKNCKELKKITINKNVITIGKNAFAGDKNLKSITIKSTKIKSIGKGAFKNINKKATIYIPKSISKKQLTKYKKMLKNAGVPKSVKIKKK